MKLDCEKYAHERVCSAKNIQDFGDVKRGIEKLRETINNTRVYDNVQVFGDARVYDDIEDYS